MKRILSTIFIVVLVALLGVSAYIGFHIFEGESPTITPIKVSSPLGKRGQLKAVIKDDGAGLRLVEIKIRQGEKIGIIKSQQFPLENRLLGSTEKTYILDTSIFPIDLGLRPGKAIIEITAFDASLRNGGKGNEITLKIPVDIDFVPPMITVLSTFHNVRPGGVGAISFQVNEPVTKAGIRVDDLFFKAYKGKDGIYRALFAIPFDNKNPKKLYVEAIDLAKNTGIGGFSYRILPRKRKVDRINIPDSFLQQKMPGFENMYPEVAAPTLVEAFLKVNSELRKKNNDFLLSLSRNSANTLLWSGAFLRFKGVRRSDFGDERHYFYHGKEIDQAFHMGVDIASIAHAPVKAANNGKVVYAGFNGIYGNTIVIDHGLGLMSLYSHLGQMSVKKGQDVKKGDIIGKTDTTGLAGGDHLHFGMMLGGVFIDPKEWWDQRWIREHIIYNLSLR